MLEDQRAERMVSDMSLTPTVTKTESRAMTMSFIDAIKAIQAGKMVRRISWANKDYCFIKDGWLSISRNGGTHQWVINDGDMDGQDWIIVTELN